MHESNEITHIAGGLWLPQDSETQITRGFAFLEFSNPKVQLAAFSIVPWRIMS